LDAETFSWLARRVVRLMAGDSSISFRMARRSSVAETMGKRMTSSHPKASTHCRGVNLRPTVAVLEPRHNQRASSANSSHARFSNNSLEKCGGRQPGKVFQKHQILVNLTSVSPNIRQARNPQQSILIQG
jgi:hypothetical protein